jgi:hypothetical protein
MNQTFTTTGEWDRADETVTLYQGPSLAEAERAEAKAKLDGYRNVAVWCD